MIFERKKQEWEDVGCFYTSKEIHQQPDTWLKTYSQIKKEKDAIAFFINKVIEEDDFDIILTGAGSSEFVGNATFPFLNYLNDFKVKSYATTDIVACPEDYLSKTKPTLLISFGRSGNSHESLGAVEVATSICKNIYHLFITCNHEGALSKYAQCKDNCYVINLTEETNDQSFAMTSSFTNMYLALILIFMLDRLDEAKLIVDDLIVKTKKFHKEDFKIIEKIVDEYAFSRIVYLGSNCLKGISQESALKLCELTAGKIMTTFDSCMGFRHGPKSVVCPFSLEVVYLSDDPYTRKYDLDIVKEMAHERKDNKILVVSSYNDQEALKYADYFISFDNDYLYDNVFLGLEYINVAQLIAMYKSIKLGIKPDTPCPSGVVNRVVKGVNIYPYIRKMELKK